MMLAHDYQQQMIQLLPSGRAWAATPGGVLDSLLGGLAEEFARIDGRANRLLDEADTMTALELLPDWERVLGLPDACMPIADNITERQIAVTQKLAAIGGQSRAYFTELAANLGYVVVIEEFSSFCAGDYAGDDVNGEDWKFTWRVNVQPPEADIPENQYILSELVAGGTAGERLRGFGALDLECIIGRASPSHTIVLFSYPVEPEPLFWADFTLP